MSMACVTEPSRIKVTFVMTAASGVATASVWLYATLPGIAPLIAGRGSVPLLCRGAWPIEPAYVHVGLALFKSMISAVLVGGSPPPAYRIFPGAYITADP